MSPGASFIAWQPVLTDHQAYTLQALSRQSGARVVAYVTRLEHAVRQAQGWTDTRVTSIERRLLPAKGGLLDSIRRLQAHRHDIHLFCSPFEQPRLILTMVLAVMLGVEFYLMSEPYSPGNEGYFDDADGLVRRLKTRLRPFVYRCYGQLIRRRVRGVFAMSSLAVAQYRRSGLPADKLFPFGYFVPRHDQLPQQATMRPAGPVLRVVFVGSLIRTKGLDLLVTAVKRLQAEGQQITLDAFGPGNPAPYGLDTAGVRYGGVIPFGQAQTVIAGYDLLVLPSRYDGWGVVVNEALLAGVPVLCSDRAGAHALVERFGAGSVFAAGDPQALYSGLQALLLNPASLAQMRAATAAAAQAIDPDVAAAYLLAVVRADAASRPRIPSPWYRTSRDNQG